MTKKVMNSAIEDSTMFGGVWFRPRAVRRIEKTITKRVKLVITTSRPGAIERTVITAISWMIRPESDARSSDPAGALLSAPVMVESRLAPPSCAPAGAAHSTRADSSMTVRQERIAGPVRSIQVTRRACSL